MCINVLWFGNGLMMMIMMDYDHNMTVCIVSIVAIGVVTCILLVVVAAFLSPIHKSVSNWSNIKITTDYIRAHTY